MLLWAGIAANLLLLGYCKYMNFFLDIANAAAGAHWHASPVLLPLGISFYTFQQISWLVDSHAGNADQRPDGFWRYALFVSFFPHLIAGPLVDHAQMMPQFAKESMFRPKWRSLAVGFSIFIIGLSKKVILADAFGAIATPVFADAARGAVPCLNAWAAAFCYSLQIYFDFSGYSDMAIGLACMFNIRLPMNFNSPFKSPSIIEFWKRWHMTMTRFFLTYVHVPLSVMLLRLRGKRDMRGDLPIHFSTFVTLLAIGFWHGANWTYVIFGALQGGAILLNHLWRAQRRPLPAVMGIFLTYCFFTLSCVVYRAENLGVAANMYRSLLAFGTFHPPYRLDWGMLWLAGACICFFLPNTQQLMRGYSPVLDARNIQKILRGAKWRPSAAWCLALTGLYIVCIGFLLDANRVQEFIYFKF